jgi:hypothetical protein
MWLLQCGVTSRHYLIGFVPVERDHRRYPSRDSKASPSQWLTLLPFLPAIKVTRPRYRASFTVGTFLLASSCFARSPPTKHLRSKPPLLLSIAPAANRTVLSTTAYTELHKLTPESLLRFIDRYTTSATIRVKES